VPNVSGLLLYTKTDEDSVPDCDFNLSGNRISVKTLDLDTDFFNTKRKLDEIVEKMLL